MSSKEREIRENEKYRIEGGKKRRWAQTLESQEEKGDSNRMKSEFKREKDMKPDKASPLSAAW